MEEKKSSKWVRILTTILQALLAALGAFAGSSF